MSVKFKNLVTALLSPVKLYCWIVAEDDGRTVHSAGAITNQVVSLNRIYSQVVMSFSIESISNF